jgi:hypothetical protein
MEPHHLIYLLSCVNTEGLVVFPEFSTQQWLLSNGFLTKDDKGHVTLSPYGNKVIAEIKDHIRKY